MIRYRENGYPLKSIKVFLDGKYVGSIVANGPGLWHYQPKGKGTCPGTSHYSIAAVKSDIESRV